MREVGVGAERARLQDLIAIEMELLAQQGRRGGTVALVGGERHGHFVQLQIVGVEVGGSEDGDGDGPGSAESRGQYRRDRS